MQLLSHTHTHNTYVRFPGCQVSPLFVSNELDSPFMLYVETPKVPATVSHRRRPTCRHAATPRAPSACGGIETGVHVCMHTNMEWHSKEAGLAETYFLHHAGAV